MGEISSLECSGLPLHVLNEDKIACDKRCNGSEPTTGQFFTQIVKVGCIPDSSGLCYATVFKPSG